MKLTPIKSLSNNLNISDDMTIGIITANGYCGEVSEDFLRGLTSEISRLTSEIKKFNIIFSVSRTSDLIVKFMKDLRIEGKEINLTGYCDMSEVFEDEYGYAKVNLNMMSKNNLHIEFFDEIFYKCSEIETVTKKADALVVLALSNYDITPYYESAKKNNKPMFYVFPEFDEFVKEGEKVEAEFAVPPST